MPTIVATTVQELKDAVEKAASESGTVAYGNRTFHYSDDHDPYEVAWLVRLATGKKVNYTRTRNYVKVKHPVYIDFPVSLLELK